MLIVIREKPGIRPRICMLGRYARERVAFGWLWCCYGEVSTGFGKTPAEAFHNWKRRNPC